MMDRRNFIETAATLGAAFALGVSSNAEARKTDLETVTLNYKTILGNDPEKDERLAYAGALSELAQFAGFLVGDNSLQVPEDAAIQLVKPESISVTIDRNKIRKQRYTRILSESKPRWDEQRQAFITRTELTLDYPRYLIRNDSTLNQLAQTVAVGYPTLEEKAQALLCLVQSAIRYDFNEHRKPDFLRDPRQTLLDQKGDCKDTSVLYANLLQCIGVTSVFILYDNHVNVGVLVDLEDHPLVEGMVCDGAVRFRNKKYYIGETTPENPMYLGKMMIDQQGKKVDYILPA